MAVSLRQADNKDGGFFFAVYSSTRAEEMKLVPWTLEQKEAFLLMQSNAQLTDYQRNYPQAQFQIIEQEGQPIGRMIVDRSQDPILLMDIALLPEYRNAGIGTTLMKDLMAEARETNRGLSLHVESFNPAKRLYERLGFVKSGESGIYCEMSWHPKVE